MTSTGPLTNGTPFSERLLGAHLSGKTKTIPLAVDPHGPTLAIKDQMLFAKGASPVPGSPQVPLTGPALEVKNYFDKLKITFNRATTVFEGLPNPGGFDDVDIVALQFPPGSTKTVFSITHDLRTSGALTKFPSSVSPNHVLIPAPNEFWCPYGPPAHLPVTPVSYPGGMQGADVTLIDSGYIWDHQHWDVSTNPHGNPLDSLTTNLDLNEAEWLQQYPPGTYTWAPGTTNVVDANNDTKLDALAGHANFVAGVIAQHCEMPNIHLWNHNSGFIYTPTSANFSTEAAILRSLVMSQQKVATPVIHIGHASPLTGNIASVAWGLAFDRIGMGLSNPRSLNDDVVLTCPAGNQGLLKPPSQGTIPRFPAALKTAYPFIKGVASVNSLGVRSPWSNHGSWVVCSAIGEEVASTFLYVHMHVEDEQPTSTGAAPPAQNFMNNSWALWNGTSFASPKIAALVAARLSPSSNASQAWASLVAAYGTVHNNDVGIIFDV
jgi:hypothetical protein